MILSSLIRTITSVYMCICARVCVRVCLCVSKKAFILLVDRRVIVLKALFKNSLRLSYGEITDPRDKTASRTGESTRRVVINIDIDHCARLLFDLFFYITKFKIESSLSLTADAGISVGSVIG